MVKELIISGYRSQHTALLARTALSRQQDELSLSSEDIAVVSRGNSGEVMILESIKLVAEQPTKDSVWKILAKVLFPREDHNGTKQAAEQEQLESMGISSRSAERISKVVPKGATAVLVMADENSRSQTSATLSAFHGTVTRVRLQCGDSASDLAALMNPQNKEMEK
jgi:uncharacterized membrane protein